jgi:hypothetical protein
MDVHDIRVEVVERGLDYLRAIAVQAWEPGREKSFPAVLGFASGFAVKNTNAMAAAFEFGSREEEVDLGSGHGSEPFVYKE